MAFHPKLWRNKVHAGLHDYVLRDWGDCRVAPMCRSGILHGHPTHCGSWEPYQTQPGVGSFSPGRASSRRGQITLRSGKAKQWHEAKFVLKRHGVTRNHIVVSEDFFCSSKSQQRCHCRCTRIGYSTNNAKSRRTIIRVNQHIYNHNDEAMWLTRTLAHEHVHIHVACESGVQAHTLDCVTTPTQQIVWALLYIRAASLQPCPRL